MKADNWLYSFPWYPVTEYRTSPAIMLVTCYPTQVNAPRGVATGVDIGIYTPKINPSKLFMG